MEQFLPRLINPFIFIITVNSIAIAGYFSNLNQEYYGVTIDGDEPNNIGFIIWLMLIQFIFIINIMNKDINYNYIYLNLLEFLIIIILTIEDELHFEISTVFLFYYLFIIVIEILFFGQSVSISAIFFGNLLFFGIYFLSNKGIGFGDVLLNALMAVKFNGILDYFRFFTLTFAIGAICSIILLFTKSLKKDDRISFIKFMAMSYLLINWLEV